MTIQEFSDQFDTLLDSHRFKDPFGDVENVGRIKLDEYEKSVFLSDSQKEIIIELYTGRNAFGAAYEETEELRKYLAEYNATETITSLSETKEGIAESSYMATLTKPALYITFEACKITTKDDCYQTKTVGCQPIRRDEYNVIKDNPFKNNKVWRVDHTLDRIELITRHKLKSYKVGYLTYPEPIILEDISPLTIEGKSTPSVGDLNSIIHTYVLERAVQKAVASIARMAPTTDN